MSKLTDFNAIMIAEGVDEVTDEKKYLRAWCHIGNKGLHLCLQGFFGRNLDVLVRQGRINLKKGKYTINKEALDS